MNERRAVVWPCLLGHSVAVFRFLWRSLKRRIDSIPGQLPDGCWAAEEKQGAGPAGGEAGEVDEVGLAVEGRGVEVAEEPGSDFEACVGEEDAEEEGSGRDAEAALGSEELVVGIDGGEGSEEGKGRA